MNAQATRRRTQRVIDFIENGIRDETFRVGQQLPSERRLVADLGVSRSTVREAFGLLAARGILRCRHGAGHFVETALESPASAPDDDRKAQEEWRALLLGGAARLAAQGATAIELQKLRKCWAALDLCLQDPDAAHRAEAPLEFLEALGSAAGNAVLRRQLKHTLVASAHAAEPHERDRQRTRYRTLLQAVLKRDAALAAELGMQCAADLDRT